MRAGPGFECQLFRASRAWGVRARPREGAESRNSGNTGSEQRGLQLRLGPRDVPSPSGDLGGVVVVVRGVAQLRCVGAVLVLPHFHTRQKVHSFLNASLVVQLLKTVV